MIKYAYDAGGLRLGMQMAHDGNKVSYGYDARGRLSGILDWSGQTTTVAFDKADRLKQIQRLWATQGVIRSEYVYDAAGRLTTLAYMSDGLTFDYAVNALGDRTEARVKS